MLIPSVKQISALAGGDFAYFLRSPWRFSLFAAICALLASIWRSKRTEYGFSILGLLQGVLPLSKRRWAFSTNPCAQLSWRALSLTSLRRAEKFVNFVLKTAAISNVLSQLAGELAILF